MGIGDNYTQAPWTPYSQTDAKLGQGFSDMGAAFDAANQKHSEAFKRHLEAVLRGDMDPKSAAVSLKSEIAGGGQPSPDGANAMPPAAPAAPPAYRAMGAAGAGPSPEPYGPGPGPQGFAAQMPQPDSSQTNYLGQPATPSRAQGNFGAYDRPMGQPSGLTGMERPAPMRPSVVGRGPMMGGPAQSAFPDAPGSGGGAPERYINTDADTRSAMALLPYFEAKKTSAPSRDYVGEIKARGDQARITEGVKQGGRVELTNMRSGEKQVELAAKLAMEQDVLKERDKNHINTIRLGYARLAMMEGMLDKNLDYKRESGADEKLKTARTVVDSMTASRGALIGSAFASTPEGQKMLSDLTGTLDTWNEVLNKYGTGQVTAAPTTSTTTRTTKTTGAKSKVPFAQRVQELKAKGMSKEQAMQQLTTEGYDLAKGQ